MIIPIIDIELILKHPYIILIYVGLLIIGLIGLFIENKSNKDIKE